MKELLKILFRPSDPRFPIPINFWLTSLILQFGLRFEHSTRDLTASKRKLSLSLLIGIRWKAVAPSTTTRASSSSKEKSSRLVYVYKNFPEDTGLIEPNQLVYNHQEKIHFCKVSF